MYLYKRKVQYYETDKIEVTRHAIYVKCMEEVRTALLESIGLPFQYVEITGIMSPMIMLSIHYKKTSTFADEIIIEIIVDKYNVVRTDFRHTMKNSETNMVIVKAMLKHCLIIGFVLNKDSHIHGYT